MTARLAALLVALAALLAAALALVSGATRIGAPAGSPADPEPALEAATRALRETLGSAGSGLPRGAEPVLLFGARDGLKDEKGVPLPLRAGSEALVVRGILPTPRVALDAHDRATGAPYAGEGGLFAAMPSRARLHVPAFPLAFNPRRLWISSPHGLGRAFDPEEARRNEPLAPLLAALASRPPAARRFVVEDAEGRAALARVVGADGSSLDSGCTCAAPAPWPGDCPPGRSGCRVELLLDFTAESSPGFVPPERLGALAAGGLLDEVLYCVVDAERPWFARGQPDGAGGWVLSRLGGDVRGLSARLSAGPPRTVSVRVSVVGSAPPARAATVSAALPSV